MLADPEFYLPAKIDLLIGAGPTLAMFSNGQIILPGKNDIILQKTKLGWMVAGGAHSSNPEKASHCMLTNLDDQIERFWNHQTWKPR